MNSKEITVVIPLYNKEREIEQTIRSVVGQSCLPREIIVLNDGSTDNSAEVVAKFNHPLIRLVNEPNRGVSAARNCAIELSDTEWVALLDGDDRWQPDYLKSICTLHDSYPDAIAYSTAFCIDSGDGKLIPANCPSTEGYVDFFKESLSKYVLIPSSTTLRRCEVIRLGGFPEGMRMGEDQYLWTLVARHGKVCFTPQAQAIYSRSASNRSASLWQGEESRHSLEELYRPEESELSNEYVARVALGKALLVSSRGGTADAEKTIKTFSWTRLNRKALRKVQLLNALPARWRSPILSLYNRLAWLILHRGL